MARHPYSQNGVARRAENNDRRVSAQGETSTKFPLLLTAATPANSDYAASNYVNGFSSPNGPDVVVAAAPIVDGSTPYPALSSLSNVSVNINGLSNRRANIVGGPSSIATGTDIDIYGGASPDNDVTLGGTSTHSNSSATTVPFIPSPTTT